MKSTYRSLCFNWTTLFVVTVPRTATHGWELKQRVTRWSIERGGGGGGHMDTYATMQRFTSHNTIFSAALLGSVEATENYTIRMI